MRTASLALATFIATTFFAASTAAAKDPIRRFECVNGSTCSVSATQKFNGVSAVEFLEISDGRVLVSVEIGANRIYTFLKATDGLQLTGFKDKTP